MDALHANIVQWLKEDWPVDGGSDDLWASNVLIIPAVISNLEVVMDFVRSELEKRDCPIFVQMKVDIAVEELFVNVCNYAYANQDEPGEVRIDYICGPNTIAVQLSDQGVPFNPLTREDPTRPTSVKDAKIGGLGIFMTKKSVDRFSYRHDGESNIVMFSKQW